MSDSGDEEAATMAAAMGFSSFGQAPAKKKRKFNASTDAFVDGQELESIDRGGKKGKGSGGNTVALGRMRAFGNGSGGAEAPSYEIPAPPTAPVGGNSEEIALDDDEGGDEERPNYVDTSLPAPAEQLRLRGGYGHSVDSSDESLLVKDSEGLAVKDMSFPPPTDPADALLTQAKIDEILASSMLPPPPLPLVHGVSVPTPPGYSDTAFMEGKVRSPSPETEMRDGYVLTTREGGVFPREIPKQRQRNERWWDGYYDPSFNVNPWEKLERERGLRAVGSWLEQGHWDFKAGVKVTTGSVSTT
jgi:hypothetical protein